MCTKCKGPASASCYSAEAALNKDAYFCLHVGKGKSTRPIILVWQQRESCHSDLRDALITLLSCEFQQMMSRPMGSEDTHLHALQKRGQKRWCHQSTELNNLGWFPLSLQQPRSSSRKTVKVWGPGNWVCHILFTLHWGEKNKIKRPGYSTLCANQLN